jgi:hypothetical protein
LDLHSLMNCVPGHNRKDLQASGYVLVDMDVYPEA